MAAATTDRAGARSRGPAPIALAAAAVFLAILALLALELRSNPRSVGIADRKPRVVVVRRVYETTVHERIIGASGPSGTVRHSAASVSTPATVANAAPTTRTS